MKQRSAEKIVRYYWNAIIGTERSVGFAAKMKAEKFTRFEKTIDELREKFGQPQHNCVYYRDPCGLNKTWQQTRKYLLN